MSMNRICQFCGYKESIRFNFGGEREKERQFHNKDWHKCNRDGLQEEKN